MKGRRRGTHARAVTRDLLITDDRFAIYRGRRLSPDWYPVEPRYRFECVHCGFLTLLLFQPAAGGGPPFGSHPECEEAASTRGSRTGGDQ